MLRPLRNVVGSSSLLHEASSLEVSYLNLLKDLTAETLNEK